MKHPVSTRQKEHVLLSNLVVHLSSDPEAQLVLPTYPATNLKWYELATSNWIEGL
jgi:hypothetical protein